MAIGCSPFRWSAPYQLSKVFMKAVVLVAVAALLAGCAGGPRIDSSHTSLGQDSRAQFIVLHYTSADLARSLELLEQDQVSSHYLIGESPPTIYRLVDEDRRAWHAGESEWRGRTWLNSSSIGIELVNPGYVEGPQGRLWYPYSEQQIDALIELLKDIMARHGLGPEAIVGHSDIAPQRKVDPGPLFPWKRLADAGLLPWAGCRRGGTPAGVVRHRAARCRLVPGPIAHAGLQGASAWASGPGDTQRDRRVSDEVPSDALRRRARCPDRGAAANLESGSIEGWQQLRVASQIGRAT